jgi:hypothetical protein
MSVAKRRPFVYFSSVAAPAAAAPASGCGGGGFSLSSISGGVTSTPGVPGITPSRGIDGCVVSFQKSRAGGFWRSCSPLR